MNKIIVFFTVLIVFYSCTNNEKKCDVARQEIFALGNKKERVVVTNECSGHVSYSQEVIHVSRDSFINDGLFKEYYPSGKLKSITYYKKDKLDSIAIAYREDGTLDFQNFFVNGQRSGLQDIYYPNGHFEQRNYHKNDSEIIFRIKYNTQNGIDSILGQLFRIDLNKKTDAYRVGDELYVINEVVVLQGFKTVLDFNLKLSGKTYLNATSSDFVHFDNKYYKGIPFKFSKSGQYTYTAKAHLVDEKTGIVLKLDSMSFDIQVK